MQAQLLLEQCISGRSGHWHTRSWMPTATFNSTVSPSHSQIQSTVGGKEYFWAMFANLWLGISGRESAVGNEKILFLSEVAWLYWRETWGCEGPTVFHEENLRVSDCASLRLCCSRVGKLSQSLSFVWYSAQARTWCRLPCDPLPFPAKTRGHASVTW